MKKIFNTDKSKLFWIYFIVALISLGFAIILIPNIWPKDSPLHNIGTKIISGIIAGSLIAYLALFLSKKFKTKQKKPMLIITIVEFILILAIAIFAILDIFNIGNAIFSAGKTFGLALWLRGVVEIFRAYYHENTDKEKYSISMLCFSIFLVTIGAYLFFSNKITNDAIIWTFISILFVVTIFCIVMGCIKKPASKKKAVVAASEDTKKDDIKDSKIEDKKVEENKDEKEVKKEEKKQAKKESKSAKKEDKEVKKVDNK